jgi:hypothetical protein
MFIKTQQLLKLVSSRVERRTANSQRVGQSENSKGDTWLTGTNQRTRKATRDRREPIRELERRHVTDENQSENSKGDT